MILYICYFSLQKIFNGLEFENTDWFEFQKTNLLFQETGGHVQIISKGTFDALNQPKSGSVELVTGRFLVGFDKQLRQMTKLISGQSNMFCLNTYIMNNNFFLGFDLEVRWKYNKEQKNSVQLSCPSSYKGN